MLRITFLAVLLLTGCQNDQAKQDQVIVRKIEQIESPLQNTAEGMAKAGIEAGIKNSIVAPASTGAVSQAGVSGTTAGSTQAR